MMLGSETRPDFAGSGAIGSQFSVDRHWKLNTKGYIQAKVRWRIRPTVLMPRGFMDGRFDNRPFRDWSTITLNDPASRDGLGLVVDHALQACSLSRRRRGQPRRSH